MSGLFTPSAEPEHYVLGHFRPNIFGGRIFGASLVFGSPIFLQATSKSIHLT